MRKIILIVLMIVLATFVIPIAFTKKFEVKQVVSNEGQQENMESLENEKTENTEATNIEQNTYTNHATIKLLHKKENTIEELNMEEYLLGVVSAEMPANFEQEALKAQAIVARTYTVYMIENSKEKHGEADICDDSTCCQAWISKEDRLARWEENERENNWKKIEDAVYTTSG